MKLTQYRHGTWGRIGGVFSGKDPTEMDLIGVLDTGLTDQFLRPIMIGVTVIVSPPLPPFPDSVPDPFSFDPLANVDVQTPMTSNPITISGVDAFWNPGSGTVPLGIPISVVTCLYSINGGPQTGVDGSVYLGDVVRLHMISSGSPGVEIIGNCTIGGLLEEWSVTTAATPPDTTPDAFSFAPVTGAVRSTRYESASIVVTGTDSPSPATVVGGEFSVNGGAWTPGLPPGSPGPSFSAFPGDSVKMAIVSSASYSTQVSCSLSIGGVSASYLVTTGDAPVVDTDPDPFSFSPNPITNATLSTSYTSSSVTISGINSPATVSVSGGGGTYSKNGGAFTSSPGTVVLGDSLRVSLLSSALYSTTTSTTLTVNGTKSATLDVITAAAPGTDVTTPLDAPSWMDGETDAYPYVKNGLEYYTSDFSTKFQIDDGIGTQIDCSTTAQFAAAVTSAKSDANVKCISLAGGVTYTYTARMLAGLNRSATNCLVIRTAIGSPSQAIMSQVSEDRGNVKGVAFVDLDIRAGLRMIGDFGTGNTNAHRDVLVEKCTGWVDMQGHNVGSNTEGAAFINLQLRLNCFIDHWGATANALTHGIYTWNVDGCLMEGNVIDHNGWNPAGDRYTHADSGGPTDHKHNIYLARPGWNNHYRFNWSSRASSHGLHSKCGANNYYNIFVMCPISAQIGYGGDGTFEKYGLVLDSVCRDNLVINADNISYNPTTQPRGQAFWTTCVQDFLLDNNVMILQQVQSVNECEFWIEQKYENIGICSNNRSHQWDVGPELHGTPNFLPQITYTNNQWGGTTLSAEAIALANTLGGSTDYQANMTNIQNYVTSRLRKGADIEQIKAWRATIIGGLS